MDKSESIITTTAGRRNDEGLHYARRGEALDDASSGESDIIGYDAEWMKARALLTEAEEKKLIRRVDWHLMSLCSLMFLFKNIDAANVRHQCPW